MMMKIPLSIIAAVILCTPLHAQRVELSVENASSVARINEPVVLSWSTLSSRLGAHSSALQLTDIHGMFIPVQLDDLDFDGEPDEVAFVSDFDAGQVRKFTLAVVGKSDAFPPRTDAQDYKRINGLLQAVDDDDVPGSGRERKAYRFDGVGWESEVIGYRLYLDERNATDIQAKRIPGLYWKWIGESGVDYQLDAFWGMDPLHVGPALGIGGIAFWIGDSVLKPLTLDRQRCRIVAHGPVRAVVRVEYFGWELGGEKVDVTSQFSIYAGDRMSEHKVTLEKSTSPRTLVTGIVKHDSTDVVWDAQRGLLYSIGPQSRANDTLLMALSVNPASVIRKTADAFNDLVLFSIEQGKPVNILLSSYWQGETGRMWNHDQIDQFLQSTVRRLSEPLRVHMN
jgi:Domain of unknown function (DUF4861)